MRPRSWRWLVTVTDLPPLPTNVEVWSGFRTKRGADDEAKKLRAAFATASHRTYSLARIDVQRASVVGRAD